jgi:hypothetical protein
MAALFLSDAAGRIALDAAGPGASPIGTASNSPHRRPKEGDPPPDGDRRRVLLFLFQAR